MYPFPFWNNYIFLQGPILISAGTCFQWSINVAHGLKWEMVSFWVQILAAKCQTTPLKIQVDQGRWIEVWRRVRGTVH